MNNILPKKINTSKISHISNLNYKNNNLVKKLDEILNKINIQVFYEYKMERDDFYCNRNFIFYFCRYYKDNFNDYLGQVNINYTKNKNVLNIKKVTIKQIIKILVAQLEFLDCARYVAECEIINSIIDELKNYLEMKQLKRSIKTVKNKVMIKI
jgi:hypothetical protein